MTTPATNPFEEWAALYAFDIIRFVREVLAAEPDVWQLEALAAYNRREPLISIVSGHGVGKTTFLAWCIVHHLLFRLPQKCVATAPTAPQLFDALFAEVKTWIGRLPEHVQSLLDVKSERVELIAARSESFFSIRTARADQPEALAGVHSEYVLLIADEASGIPEPIFEAAAGSMSGHNAMTILTGNPVRTSGLFFDTHHKLKDMWWTLRVSCLDSVRVSEAYVADMARRYGRDSNAFRVRVLGLFPRAENDTVIPFELVESALAREVLPVRSAPIVWGLDPAWLGADSAALCKRRGNALMGPIVTYQQLDTMQLAGRVKHEWDITAPPDRPVEIVVDVIGIGAGVAERLRELGLPITSVNVAESPALSGEKYKNQRAELWFKGREWFAKRDCVLPNDELLVEELVSQEFEIAESSGKIALKPKKDMRKKIGRSPDRADAFLLTFASTASQTSGLPGIKWTQPIKRELRSIV